MKTINALRLKLRAVRGLPHTSRIIFVIGTGRSGTHWVGHILDGHPDIRATIEGTTVFRMVTEAAINENRKPSLMPSIIRRYRLEHARTAPMLYCDKSHPNIWHVEELAVAFPTAVFVGITRGVFATVASMLQHGGVRRWCEEWDRYPVPNRFLGVRMDNINAYAEISLAERCALRWKSHMDRMEELQDVMGDRLFVASYEKLIVDTENQLELLSSFLKLSESLKSPPVKKESLDRWKTELNHEQVEAIEAIVENGLPMRVHS